MAQNSLLDLISDAYQRNIGRPFAQIAGNGVRGLLGLDPGDYADGLGMEAYRNAQALSMAPTPLAFAALPAAVVKGAKASKAVKAAPRDEALETARKNGVKMLGLPENNTAMDRARALGFDTDAAHFSRHGIDATELDSGKYAVAPFDAVGTHVGSKEAALDRFKNTVGTTGDIKGSTYPVLIKRGKEFLSDGKPWEEDKLSSILRKRGGHDWSDMNGGRMTYQQMNSDLRKKLFSEFDSIPYVNDVEAKGQISHIVPPHNIRSRFAAFDPARVNENDLLGRADPLLLSLIAAGASVPVGYGLLTSNRDAKK